MLRDASEHFRANFDAIMKSPDVIGKLGIPVPQLNVRAGL